MMDLEKLEALAKAATPGPWNRSERPNGPFWHIHSDHTIDGKRCLSGRQSIAAMHAENKKTGSKAYAAMFEANADYVAATNPTAILALIAEVRALREMVDAIPKTPEAVIAFIGPHFSSMEAQDWTDDLLAAPTGNLSMVKYSLMVHDLLSAFDWAGLGEQAIDFARK